MLIYVRHGKTSHNLGGSDEKLRGWLPLPLTDEGRKQADLTGKHLKGVNRPITFSSSDLPRAMESAKIIGKHIGMNPTPDPAIRDWNTGRLAGKKFESVKHIIFDLIDHPDKPAPGGESLNNYLARFVPAMRKRAMDKSTHLVVGHARGATILQGIASDKGGRGGEIDPKFLKQRPDVGPSEILINPADWYQRIVRDHLKGSK